LLAQSGPSHALAETLHLALSAAFAPDLKDAMQRLRRAKRQMALAVGLADIAGLWRLEEVTQALSDFADAAVKGALRFLLREAAIRAHMDANEPAHLEATTGLTILAMGKYGAYELNYSSDIDLIVFYDAQRFPFATKNGARAAAVEMVKGLVRLLSETTVDGYVFRTDLRLRPDAGATQVAISLDAAEAYYEDMGQNWERAALIKARPCAGDPKTGADFARLIAPFVWRRNLDYAAIEDIHSIKRQIHAHAGHGVIAVAGHNIKLGRGGIREIEFFAQTQQLILGGRDPSLRERGTLAAIRALTARGLVSERAERDLTHAYRFLRTLEHRLQMIEDQQTHSVPKDPQDVRRIASFMAFDSEHTFSQALRHELETVQEHYAHLFEQAAPLASAAGSLVFTGVEDDPETLETLRQMGFRDASHIAHTIRSWHHGRIRATRSARARELLTALIPGLLGALANTADPDAAFNQFDRFISCLPSGVQALSLFLNNSRLLQLIANVAGAAPRLATHLGRNPAVLDALMDPGYLGELPRRAQLEQDLGSLLRPSASYEEVLDAARRFAREQIFRVGVQIIEGNAEAAEAGPALANVAEAIIRALLPAAAQELEAAHGRVTGGEFVVIAMGKLGGREMTATSDLDLICVYDAPDGIEQSDGARPLPVSTYYARLAQRFIAALTAQTAQGGLYEVDMRLRPTGNKGPVAVSLTSFARYHAEQAWTWERMALTRARVIAGSSGLAARAADAVRAALTRPFESARLFQDARDMRDRLAAQFPGKNHWDIKYARGGLIDLEFITQTLQLARAAANPDVLESSTIAALAKLERDGTLAADEALTLIESAALQNDLLQILRITLEAPLDRASATPGLEALLTRASRQQDFRAVEAALTRAQAAVREVWERRMGQPTQ
ncbi:MAG: bifunctional [glutamine synthetase] adenylyltransferase/[glutamine synthetase]-adenylyl-L-tyrosine phosphorylase, partial [Alphaproteobacteria bacterium]|nr:bifunctional [glutamine synthetase] adenylyltransferase/[glutamine synthetase]-adenylyl-L-tyrosine phosphorylase [Alphaproteobacteria bacterium]